MYVQRIRGIETSYNKNSHTNSHYFNVHQELQILYQTQFNSNSYTSTVLLESVHEPVMDEWWGFWNYCKEISPEKSRKKKHDYTLLFQILVGSVTAVLSLSIGCKSRTFAWSSLEQSNTIKLCALVSKGICRDTNPHFRSVLKKSRVIFESKQHKTCCLQNDGSSFWRGSFLLCLSVSGGDEGYDEARITVCWDYKQLFSACVRV